MPGLTRKDEVALRTLYRRWRRASDEIIALDRRRAELDREARDVDDSGADLAVACRLVSPFGAEDWTQALERIERDRAPEGGGSV